MLRVKFLSVLALRFTIVVAIALADPGQRRTMINTLEKRNLVTTLGPQLSSGASLYTRSSPEWAEQSSRWSTYSAPTFDLVVVPAVENDIAVTVTTPIYPERRPVSDLTKIYSYNTLPAMTSPFLRRALAMVSVQPSA